jgi:DNA-binding NarL/FixJ family response regulator
MHIVIADDHSLILAGFSNLIKSKEWSHHLTTVENKGELLHVLKNNRVDILFQDLKFGDHDARTFIQTVQQLSPDTRIVVISTIMDAATVRMLQQMGIHGYISKSDDSKEIIEAIKAMEMGETYWSMEITSVLQSHKSS